MGTLKKLNKWIAVILFAFISVMLAIFLYNFYTVVQISSKIIEEEHLLQNTKTTATMIREKIKSDLNTVYGLASMLSSFDSINSEEAKAFIHKAGQEYPFSILMVTDLKGNYYTNNNSEINLKEPYYLIGDTSNNKRITVIYQNALYGRDMISLDSPIYNGDQIVGMVSGLFYVDYINNILSETINGNENKHQYQIVEKNGDFILSSDLSVFHDYADLFDFLDSIAIDKKSPNDNLLKNFLNEKESAYSYTINEENKLLCYMPIGINEWQLISTSPSSGVDLQRMSIQNPTVMLAIRIVALFVVLIIYIIWRQMIYRGTMERSKYELETLNELLYRKNEHLKLKAENDLLTGLYNKMTSEWMIADYLDNEGRDGRHALLVIDIDDFKGINDALGHFYGDRALMDVSQAMVQCLRTSDIKGRIGGDEFIILFKDFKSEEDLKHKVIELSEKIKQITHEEEPLFRISGSIGVSIYPDHGANYTDLFLKADDAMYFSKEHGKGGYSIYSSNLENWI